MIRRASVVGLGLLLLALGLLAYNGGLQPGLDRWTADDLVGASEFFESRQADAQEGELARLNRFISRGELALDKLARWKRERADCAPGGPPPEAGPLEVGLRVEAPSATGPPPPRVFPLAQDFGPGPGTPCSELRAVVQGLEAASWSGDRQILAWHHGGRFALAAGDSEHGLALLEKAYRRRPERQDFANPLLLELMRLGQAERLAATGRHHAEQRPDNPTAWWALGEADRLRGLEGRAIGQFKRGIDVFPLEPMLETGIALAVATGRDELARDWLATLRLRYGGPERTPRLEAWCDSIGCGPLWRSLPPDTESSRYADRFPQFFPVGREWTYNVRYGFLPLGKLVVGVLGREDIPGPDGAAQEAYRVVYRVDSNPIYKLLIDLHDVYEAVIPAHCLHSTEFVTRSRQNGERYDRIYEFDQDEMLMTARGYRVEGDVYRLQVPIARQLFDGLSLLFAARRQVLEGRYGPVLTIVDEEVHRTVIDADGRGKVKALGRSRSVIQLHGTADYQGIAGLTGEFWGSLSDDDEALPLAARFQIKVGRITIELEDVREGDAGGRP